MFSDPQNYLHPLAVRAMAKNVRASFMREGYRICEACGCMFLPKRVISFDRCDMFACIEAQIEQHKDVRYASGRFN